MYSKRRINFVFGEEGSEEVDGGVVLTPAVLNQLPEKTLAVSTTRVDFEALRRNGQTVDI